MNAPPSIFQTPEEFRKQGHLYRGAKWLSVDESKPDLGIEEGVFKIFISGGSLCLRKNHEAETHYESWSNCGETWAMNPGDTPRVPGAMESAYKRRLRCVRMRAKFTSAPGEVDPHSRIFRSGDNLKGWLRGPEATSVFWARILMPPIRKSSKASCERAAQLPSREVEADTLWLREKMARRAQTTHPEDQGDAQQNARAREVQISQTTEGKVARGTHRSVFHGKHGCRDLWESQLSRLAAVPSNRGVTSRRGPEDRRPTKRDISDDINISLSYKENGMANASRKQDAEIYIPPS